jgi:hypothetical protein
MPDSSFPSFLAQVAAERHSNVECRCNPFASINLHLVLRMNSFWRDSRGGGNIELTQLTRKEWVFRKFRN